MRRNLHMHACLSSSFQIWQRSILARGEPDQTKCDKVSIDHACDEACRSPLYVITPVYISECAHRNDNWIFLMSVDSHSHDLKEMFHAPVNVICPLISS